MNKQMICIECPLGCTLSVDCEGCTVSNVSGNKCPKGIEYAKSEIENPQRILTAAVVCKGLPIKMLSVRTDRAIPKSRIMEAMREVKKLTVTRPVAIGAVIKADLLGLGVNLISTRTIT